MEDYLKSRHLLQATGSDDASLPNEIVLSARLLFLLIAKGMFEEASNECDRLISLSEKGGSKFNDYLKRAHQKKQEIAQRDSSMGIQTEEEEQLRARLKQQA